MLKQASMPLLLMLCINGPIAQAQTPANAWNCPQKAMEPDKQWYERCSAILAQQTQAPFEVAKLRASLEQRPALPPAKNRLLGRWSQPPQSGGSSDNFLGQLLQGLNGCTALFGDGSVEFRADRWILADSDGPTDMGAVTYREGNDGAVFVLPAQGLQLLPVRLENADRWSLIGAPLPCVMVRVGSANPPVPAAAPGTRRAPSTPVSAARLAVGPDAGGYDCPDGRQLYVKSCYDENPQANCGVVNLHLPLSRGYQVETTATRSELIASVASCTVRPVQFLDGVVSLDRRQP